jgi:hypothetical protein
MRLAQHELDNEIYELLLSMQSESELSTLNFPLQSKGDDFKPTLSIVCIHVPIYA